MLDFRWRLRRLYRSVSLPRGAATALKHWLHRLTPRWWLSLGLNPKKFCTLWCVWAQHHSRHHHQDVLLFASELFRLVSLCLTPCWLDTWRKRAVSLLSLTDVDRLTAERWAIEDINEIWDCTDVGIETDFFLRIEEGFLCVFCNCAALWGIALNRRPSCPYVCCEPEDTLNWVVDAFCMSVSFSSAEWSLSSCPLTLTLHPVRVTSILVHLGFTFVSKCVSQSLIVLVFCVSMSQWAGSSVCARLLCTHKLTHVCTYLCAIILTVKAIAPNLPPQREYWY